MPPASLTPRQQQILNLIREHIALHQSPPTQAEITAAMGFRSRTAAKDHLRALQNKGVLELVPGSSRGIRLLEPGADEGLPLVGRVAAGLPILAVENIASRHRVDPALFRPRADYLLKVRGESMTGAGIADGDLLAVHQTPQAAEGQIVVARLEDEVTVKRFTRRGAIVELQPANPAFEPIRVDLRRQELVIEGRMVGLIRQHS